MKKTLILSCSFVFAATMFFGVETASAQPGRKPSPPTPQKVVVVSPQAQHVKPSQGPTKVIVDPRSNNHKPIIIDSRNNKNDHRHDNRNDHRNDHRYDNRNDHRNDHRYDPRKNDNRWNSGPNHNDKHHNHNHNHNHHDDHHHHSISHVPMLTPSPVPVHVPVPVRAKEPSFQLKIGSVGIIVK